MPLEMYNSYLSILKSTLRYCCLDPKGISAAYFLESVLGWATRLSFCSYAGYVIDSIIYASVVTKREVLSLQRLEEA
jgi:hypothetical protein